MNTAGKRDDAAAPGRGQGGEAVACATPGAAAARRLPRVLVLMATFDGAAWVAEQLESILAQQRVEVAIRLADDCSRDDTLACVRAVEARHPGVPVSVVARAVPSGSAGANFRRLLAETEVEAFDYVALSDQDDLWDADHLARGCEALDRNGCAGYSCAVRTFGAGEEAVLRQVTRMRALDFLFEGAGQGCTFVMTAALAARVRAVCREHSREVAALHYHDWLVYLVARTAGARWFFDPHPSLRYRQHGSNEIGARNARAALARRLALIRNGWYAEQVRAATVLACRLAPGNAALAHFERLLGSRPGAMRRLRLAAAMLRVSRRRAVDVCMLVASALAGWI
ncbi:MAG: glycosyltransferase [Burkholderiaceae bacterium]